jgi:hypothetical protein
MLHSGAISPATGRLLKPLDGPRMMWIGSSPCSMRGIAGFGSGALLAAKRPTARLLRPAHPREKPALST